jgi:hypothetical protein
MTYEASSDEPVFFPSEPVPVTLAHGEVVLLTTVTFNNTQTDLVLLNTTTMAVVTQWTAGNQHDREATRIPFCLHGQFFQASL